MEIKRIKNFLVKQMIPLSFAVSLMGCGVEGSKRVEEKLEYVNDIMEEDEKLEFSLEDAMVFDVETEEDDIFFTKVEEGEVSLDDIILTREERDSSDCCNDFLERYMLRQLDYSEFDSTVQNLNVQKFANLLSSSIVTNQVEEHQNSSLYVEDTNDLNWELLFSVLKQNGEKYIKDSSEAAHIGVLDEATGNPCEILFLDDDLKEWIRQFREFLTFARKDRPSLDMRRLACTLEQYYICYRVPTVFDDGVLAVTNPFQMTYPLWNGYYPDMVSMEAVNYHEFYHLINLACPDETDEYAFLTPSGIKIMLSASFDYDFRSQYNVNYRDTSVYFPYNYSFLEEANAEKYSSSLLGTESNSNLEQICTVENIELSLFLQPGFHLQNFQKAAMLHNPIAIMQQFPVLGDFKDEQEKFFFAQLEMLESFNVVHNLENYIRFSGIKTEEQAEEESFEQLALLENYADLQMTRNFIWNLFNSKSITKPDITLGDCYYLMRLFEQRLECQRKMVASKYQDFSIELDDSLYLEKQEENLQLFCSYLRDMYFYSDFREYGFYSDYSLETSTLSSAFTEEEKNYFSNLYDGIQRNYDLLEKQENATPASLEEEIKTYYKIP